MMKRKGKNESSPSLIDAQNTLKALSECNDQNQQIQLLMKFTIHFEEFLIDTENQKLINKHSLTFTNQLMNYSHLALNSIPLLISYLRILSKVHSISTISIHPKESVPLFISIFTTANSFFEMVQECTQVIEYFLKDESFFSLFLAQRGIYIIFQTAFFQDSSTKQFSQYINILLFKKLPIQHYSNFQFEDFFLDILKIKKESISEKIISEYLFFISHLFNIMTHFVKNSSTFFINEGIFSMYDELLKKTAKNQYLQNYKIFISSLNDDMSEPPNIQFLRQMFRKYQTSPPMSSEKNDCFQLILAFIVSDSKSALKVNEATPFLDYFATGDPPIQHLVSLFAGVNSVQPDMIPSLIKPLFGKLMKEVAETANYLLIVYILDNQLKTKRISPEFLLKSDFIAAFFRLNGPKEPLYEILTKDSIFQSITIDVFKLKQAEPYQTGIFSTILELYEFFEDKNQFISIVEDYLMISPCQTIIALVINKISETRSKLLINLLMKIFGIKKEASINFVNADGINWVFKIYNEKFIELKGIADILSKLVTFNGIPEIDYVIRQLPADHDFFKISPNLLIDIAYGQNPKFPIIRTTAVIPLIPPINDLDPYNAWILGSRFVDQYRDNIFEMPMLNKIINRYVKPEFIPQLLTRPDLLSDFVDMSFDHFPVFQFFPFILKDANINDNSNDNDLLKLNDHLVIQKRFLQMSFWFKFTEIVESQEVFFKTNNLMISIKPNNVLLINSENTIKEIQIDSLNWNFVFIKIKSSIMNRMITIYINSNSYHFVTKLQTFSYACFSHYINGIMFLGATIRLYNIIAVKQDQIDFRILYKKGAGFMKAFLSREEEIFTPSKIKIPSSKIIVPDNCFSVPYFGFPMHFSSIKHLDKLIEIMENSESLETYDSLFNMILRIRTIDDFNSQFFARIINSMKKNNKFLTKNHFVSFLKIVKAKPSHLPIMLYDRDLWKHISNDIIIESLFEYYSDNVNWQSFENIELFLSTVVCENPTSKTIINALLTNHSKIPKFMKFLISILKTAPAIRQENCSWDSVEFREETQIQNTILDCFCTFVQPNNIDLIVSLMPYEDLRSLMVVSPRSISAKVFHLISVIAKINPNYIPNSDPILITAVSFLSSYESVWDDIIEMKPINFPLYLVLIWAGGICMIHQNTYDIPSNPHLEKIETLLKKIIEICSSGNTLTKIISNELCVSMITSWFPFILHYNVLFQAFPEEEININKPFEPLTMSQFPDAFDPIWIGTDQVLSETAFPLPPQAEKASQFMLEKVTSVLMSNGFQVPFPSLKSMKRVSEWFLQSLLLPFITDLILLSPPQMLNKVLYAFFFEFVIGNPQHTDPLTPIFFQSIINRLSNFFTWSPSTSQSTMTTNQILHFLHIFTGLQYLQDSSLVIISDLLTLAQLIQTKQGNSILTKYSNSIEPIILSLFSSIRINDYQNVFALLTTNIQMFATLITTEKSQLTWIYVFFIASHNERKSLNTFLNKLTPLLKLDQKSSKLMKQLINKTIEKDLQSLSTIEEAWKQKSNDFQAKFKQYYTNIKDVKPAFPSDIGILSIDYKQQQFLSNCRHFLITKLFMNTIKYLSISFLIRQEQNQWLRVTHEILENPKQIEKEHLSPFFFPYSLPRVLTPSPYPCINIHKDVNIRSVPIKLFKQNLLYLYSAVPDVKPSSIKIFIDLNSNLRQPLIVSNCSISRYNGVINSVLFMFNDQMKIICNCSLSANNDDIDFQKEIKTSINHFFIESVLIGHWGITEMFCSKVVITVKLSDLINIQKYKPDEDTNDLIIYSFTVGNFILSLPKKELVAKILKLKESIISNYSYYSISNPNSDDSPNKKPKNKNKTLMIAVPGSESNEVIKIKPNARKGNLFPNFNWETDFNINETIQNFCSGKLSAFETLLRINNVCGTSFLALDNYPVAPSFNFEEIFPDENQRPDLCSLQPIMYFQSFYKNASNTLPLNFFGCIDFYNSDNLKHFFKLKDTLESNSMKILILNIISKKFHIPLKNNKYCFSNYMPERKNIALVVSELNSPLNFKISHNFSSAFLIPPNETSLDQPTLKNEQLEQMEEDQDEVEPDFPETKSVEMIDQTDEEPNYEERTDEDVIEEEEMDEEETSDEKEEKQAEQENKQAGQEEKQTEQEEKQTEQEEKQKEKEKKQTEKEEKQTEQNEKQTEQEEKQTEQEEKQEEKQAEQGEKQTETNELKQSEDHHETEQQNQEPKQPEQSNPNSKQNEASDDEPKYDSNLDLTQIIQSVGSSDLSDLIDSLSISDEYTATLDSKGRRLSLLSGIPKTASDDSIQQKPKSDPITSAPQSNPLLPKISLISPMFNPIIPPSRRTSFSNNASPTHSHEPLNSEEVVEMPPAKAASVNPKLRMQSSLNVPTKVRLFVPSKFCKMSGINEIAMFSKVDRILPLPKLSEICLNQFVITIESIEMKIISRKGKQLFASIVNPHFEYATSINVSKNGLFLVVDTQLSLSETYQIFYRDGYPFKFELKHSMSFNDGIPSSIVVGETWSVITHIGNLIVMWNLFRNFVYRTIDTEQKYLENEEQKDIDSSKDKIIDSNGFLEAVSYDENFDIIWYATKNGIYTISASGKLIGSTERKDMPSRISTIKAVNLPFWQIDRIALIGDEIGRIYFAFISYDNKKIEIKRLEKYHDCKIVQFDVNQDFTAFLSTDIKGNIYTWKI